MWQFFFIVSEFHLWPQDLNTDFDSWSWLFGDFNLTKNADPSKYLYSGFGVEFDPHGQNPLPDISVGSSVNIFRVDMSSCSDINNRGKDILILGEGSTEGLNFTLAAETP